MEDLELPVLVVIGTWEEEAFTPTIEVRYVAEQESVVPAGIAGPDPHETAAVGAADDATRFVAGFESLAGLEPDAQFLI